MLNRYRGSVPPSLNIAQNKDAHQNRCDKPCMQWHGSEHSSVDPENVRRPIQTNTTSSGNRYVGPESCTAYPMLKKIPPSSHA